MKKNIEIRYYVYNYKTTIENKQISSSSIAERNYIKLYENNTKIIKDVPYNLFRFYNILKKYFLYKMNNFIIKLLDMINLSAFSYDIDINYIYCKTKLKNNIKSCFNNYYELNINCYDEKRKIGFSKKFKVKSLSFNKLKKEIVYYESILKNNAELREGIIDSKNIIFEKYAFSQILSFYKKDLWKIRNSINKDNEIKMCTCKKNTFNIDFYDKKGRKNNNTKLKSNTTLNNMISNKNFLFKNINTTNNILEQLNSGYIITNVYFLNNSKENRNIIKLLCSGYYIKNKKIKFIFSNRVLTFNLLSLINGIKYVSNDRIFSNEFNCPDILTELKKSSKITS